MKHCLAAWLPILARFTSPFLLVFGAHWFDELRVCVHAKPKNAWYLNFGDRFVGVRAMRHHLRLPESRQPWGEERGENRRGCPAYRCHATEGT